MRANWFHILLALSQEDLHGSGIVRAVLGQTDGALRLWPATLYGALDEISEHGWIEEVTDPAERPPGESGRKRFYRLTSAGAAALREEAARLQVLARRALGSPAIQDLET